jgi:ribosomal protein S25
MKGGLAKVWHDPVWSKVISGLILATLSAAGLWAWSGFSSNLAVIWASTLSIWTWLASPVPAPFGIMLLTLITFAAIAWWLIDERRRAVKRVADYGTKVLLDQADEKRRELKEMGDKLRACETAKARVEAELAEHAEESSRLYPLAEEVLRHLCKRYPTIEEVRSIASRFNIPHVAAEKVLLDLKELGIARLVVAPYSTPDAGWTLTEKGVRNCSKYPAF